MMRRGLPSGNGVARGTWCVQDIDAIFMVDPGIL